MRVSNRSRVAPFQVMDVLSAANVLAQAGREVFHLEAGEPGGPLPQAVLDAAQRALQERRIGYTEPLGIPQLRQRIATSYGERYGIDLSPRRVVVTAGASAGFILSFLAAFDAGACVGMGVPGYPAYRNILEVLGLRPVDFRTTPQSLYQPEPAQLRDAPELDGVLIQSPANPTGTMLGASGLKALCEAARTRDAIFISDEIYHGITFGTAAHSALEFDDEAIVINSFSKYYCMTGWRIGWMVIPEILIRPVECLAQNLFISPNALSQYAALGAFEARGELEARVAGYRRNRDVLLRALKDAGMRDVLAPEGAFYIYCDVSHLTNDSESFCKALLDETGVAATPGTDFDPGMGRTTIRFSFAGDASDIERAAAALRTWMARGAQA